MIWDTYMTSTLNLTEKLLHGSLGINTFTTGPSDAQKHDAYALLNVQIKHQTYYMWHWYALWGFIKHDIIMVNIFCFTLTMKDHSRLLLHQHMCIIYQSDNRFPASDNKYDRISSELMIQMLAESATFESSSDACVSSQLLQWTKTETKVKTTKNIYISWNKQAGNDIKLKIINVLFHLISKATFVMFLGLLITTAVWFIYFNFR